MTKRATRHAYAVFNEAIEEAIAIFPTKEAAEAYAADFQQCKVFGWTVPAAIFYMEGSF